MIIYYYNNWGCQKTIFEHHFHKYFVYIWTKVKFAWYYITLIHLINRNIWKPITSGFWYHKPSVTPKIFGKTSEHQINWPQVFFSRNLRGTKKGALILKESAIHQRLERLVAPGLSDAHSYALSAKVVQDDSGNGVPDKGDTASLRVGNQNKYQRYTIYLWIFGSIY